MKVCELGRRVEKERAGLEKLWEEEGWDLIVWNQTRRKKWSRAAQEKALADNRQNLFAKKCLKVCLHLEGPFKLLFRLLSTNSGVIIVGGY